MKDFMLIFRGGSDNIEQSPDEMQAHMQKWFEWVEDLKAKKIYVAGEALIPGDYPDFRFNGVVEVREVMKFDQ